MAIELSNKDEHLASDTCLMWKFWQTLKMSVMYGLMPSCGNTDKWWNDD